MRREILNGGKSGTARNPRRRGIPEGAESQKARNPERRKIPNGAEFQTAPSCEFTPSGTSRFLGFRAVWDFALSGI